MSISTEDWRSKEHLARIQKDSSSERRALSNITEREINALWYLARPRTLDPGLRPRVVQGNLYTFNH